jgi:hypothetical protein
MKNSSSLLEPPKKKQESTHCQSTFPPKTILQSRSLKTLVAPKPHPTQPRIPSQNSSAYPSSSLSALNPPLGSGLSTIINGFPSASSSRLPNRRMRSGILILKHQLAQHLAQNGFENLLLHTRPIVLHNPINLFLLALLHRHQPCIHRIPNAQARHVRLAVLADAEDAAESLLFGRRVPPGIDHDDAGGHGEVEAHWCLC